MSQVSLARLIEREGVADPRIVDAFRAVPRADFVPRHARAMAYADRPIGIPDSQTTSQPTLIAHMLDAVAPAAEDVALEVGTGYGFQTALLARLCRQVFSIDRAPDLVTAARRNLERAGVTNVDVRVGDGWRGLPEDGPFDVIVVSAAADEMPQALAEQLAQGARMVIPLRGATGDDVVLFTKADDVLKRVRLVTPARFVPLVRDA